MPLSSHFSFPHSYFRVTRLCLGFCFLHLHAHWGPYLGALMEQTCCIHPYIRALLLNTFQKYMFLASYPCKLFPMHVMGWSLCMKPVSLDAFDCSIDTPIWCETLVYWWLSDVQWKHFSQRKRKWLPIVYSTTESCFPYIKVSAHIFCGIVCTKLTCIASL